MSHILALESSTEKCSVAVWVNGHLRVREVSGERHSESLLPLVNTLMKEAGLSLGQLDAVAYGQGPGSFTGVRLACSVAQGLAFGLGIPTLPVSSLMALAAGTNARQVLAVLDARMGQIYLGAYGMIENDWMTLMAPCLCDPEAPPDLPATGASWHLVGSGAERHASVLANAWHLTSPVVLQGRYPHASQVAEIGAGLLGRGQGLPPEEATPVYLRDKVALTIEERQRK